MSKKRTIMRALKLTEISGVDVPAQEGAQVVLMKRAFTAEERRNLASEGKALPDGSFPIVSRGDLSNAIQAFGRANNKAQVARHIRSRAKALGATDLLPKEGALADLLKKEASSSKTAGDPGKVGQQEGTHMTDKTNKAGEPTVEELQAQIARVTQISELNDAEKAHFQSLEGDAADAFLAKSADDRKAEIADVAKRAQDDDPVVYKTLDGIELRKSAGDAIIAMAKSNDTLRKQNEELIEKQQTAALEKRAEDELGNLPGTVAERAALLKSIDGITDENARQAALNALKAGNDAAGANFHTAGVGGVPAQAGSPEAELDELAKQHQAKEGGTIEQAMSKVLDTPKGAELYAKSVN